MSYRNPKFGRSLCIAHGDARHLDESVEACQDVTSSGVERKMSTFSHFAHDRLDSLRVACV